MNSSIEYEEVLKLASELSIDKLHSFPGNDTSPSSGKMLYSSPNSTVYLESMSSENDNSLNNSPRKAKELCVVKTVKDQAFWYLLGKEYRILKELNHPHIIKPIDFSKTKSLQEATASLYLPYYSKGELFHLVKSKNGLGESLASAYLKQISSAIDYLHEMNIAHRDIKLENILVDDLSNAKLIDFGFWYLSEYQSEEEQSKDIQTRVLENSIEANIMGTAAYLSPELIQLTNSGDLSICDSPDKIAEKLETLKAGDIFALGVTLFTMVTGVAPFAVATKNDSNYRALLLGMKKKWDWFWKKHIIAKSMNEKGLLSEEFKDLVVGMLHPNPSERYNITTVVNHPWMSKYAQSVSEETNPVLW